MEKNLITEDYVSFETSKLLKEKGFNIVTEKCYILDNAGLCAVSIGQIFNGSPQGKHEIAAPTLHIARKWLNKVKGIGNYISCENIEERYYWVAFRRPSYIRTRSEKTFATEKEAAEDLIKYCLTNLID